jgi:hypothetical protein
MDDGLVHRRTRRAEVGEFRLGTIALEDVLRRHGLRRALISKRALDDRPIDTPRTAFGRRFAFSRRRRRNVFVAAIDHRFEGIELRRRLIIAPIAAATAIAAFAEGLAALAAPRSTIAITPLAIAGLAFAGLTFAALTSSLTIASLTVTRLAIRALTFAPLIAALTALAIATAARSPLTRATLTTLLLLLLLFALGRLSRCALTTGSHTFGPCAMAASATTAWTIAGW